MNPSIQKLHKSPFVFYTKVNSERHSTMSRRVGGREKQLCFLLDWHETKYCGALFL